MCWECNSLFQENGYTNRHRPTTSVTRYKNTDTSICFFYVSSHITPHILLHGMVQTHRSLLKKAQTKLSPKNDNFLQRRRIGHSRELYLKNFSYFNFKFLLLGHTLIGGVFAKHLKYIQVF